MTPFRGTYTALVTPFRNGKLDLEALDKLVERQIDAGVDGLVPCGTTGESPTLTLEEHRRVLECVVRARDDRLEAGPTGAGPTLQIPIVAGAGTNSTARTIELARTAADCGVDGLLLVAPYYNKPSQPGLFEHFSAVACEVKLPIVLYNIPGRCGVEIAVETIRRLCEAHENIVAVKHATGSVAGAADLLAACDVALLSGDDPVTLPLMSLGAVGVISVLSNLAPRSVKRLTQAALTGDFAAALDAHRAVYPLARSLLSLDTNPIPIKTALAARGWCAEEFRLPLCRMEPTKRARLIGLVNESSLQ